MEKLVEFLFKTGPASQLDNAPSTTLADSANIKTYASSGSIAAECIKFASTTFGVLKITHAKTSVRGVRLAFPSQTENTRKHLAPIDMLYTTIEWNPEWLKEEPCEIACKMTCFDGFEYHRGQLFSTDCSAQRSTIYKACAGYQAGIINTFESIDDIQSELSISFESNRLLHLTMIKKSADDKGSSLSLSEQWASIPGTIISFAARQQLLSWSMNARLLDDISALHAAVNETRAVAVRMAEKIASEREKIVRAATKLINSKKEKIRQLESQRDNAPRCDLPSSVIKTMEPSPKASSKAKAKAKGNARRGRKADHSPISVRKLTKKTGKTSSDSPDLSQPDIDPFAGFDDD